MKNKMLKNIKISNFGLITVNHTCDFSIFSKEEKNRIGAHESIWARRGAEQSLNTGKSARDE